MEQLPFVKLFGMNGFHGKLSVGECARLIEDHSINFCQHVQIVGSLHQNAVTGGPAESAEECQRHTDDQCAGTGNDEEYQCSVEPYGEGRHEFRAHEHGDKGRDDSQCQCGKDDDRCVDTCKAGDESLALRLPFASLLDEMDDLGNGAFAKSLCRADFDNTLQVDAAGKHLVAD